MVSIPPVTEALRRRAAAAPGQWVYAIDPEFDADGAVPPYGVVGAWKVTDDGLISDEFVQNPNCRPSPIALGHPKPRTELEQAVQLFATGRLNESDLLRTFGCADVTVFSRAGSDDLFVVTDPSGTRVTYAFTDETLAAMFGWDGLAQRRGSDLLSDLPSGVAVLINPGSYLEVLLPQ